MERRSIKPRSSWEKIVESQGLCFHTFKKNIYWNESAYYYFTSKEIDEIERATIVLNDLCEKAVDSIIRNQCYEGFDFSPLAISLIEKSYNQKWPSLYGRFDLAYDGFNPPKMLEYNADTPMALLEASIIQLEWLRSVKPEADQFNNIHHDLIKAWKELIPKNCLIHFCGYLNYQEDYGTILYLADTALQVTKKVAVSDIRDIGFGTNKFENTIELYDNGLNKIKYLYKLYPWEELLKDQYANHILKSDTIIFEPPWRMILQNKNILKVLWEMFPDCPYLLPAHSSPKNFSSPFVAKPKWGREGKHVFPSEPGKPILFPDKKKESDFICQEWMSLKSYDGYYPTIGSWIINGKASGIGVREDKSPVINDNSMFTPHCFLE